jgi:C-terminal processing protease CtpA/Prc
MTGVGYEIEGSSIVVKHVISGSAADAAGVLEGDILVKLNGTPVGADDLDELETLMPGEEGSSLELVVLRDGAEISLDITLSKLLSAD